MIHTSFAIMRLFSHKMSPSFSTHVCTEVETGNFIAMEHNVLLNAGKSVFQMTETLWANSIINSKMYELAMQISLLL